MGTTLTLYTRANSHQRGTKQYRDDILKGRGECYGPDWEQRERLDGSRTGTSRGLVTDRSRDGTTIMDRYNAGLAGLGVSRIARQSRLSRQARLGKAEGL
jgi:hypothetical protein